MRGESGDVTVDSSMIYDSISTGTAIKSSLYDVLGSIIYGLRMELLVFVLSVLAYCIVLRPFRRTAKREFVSDDPEECAKQLDISGSRGDHRTVLKCWNVIKKDAAYTRVNLVHVVTALQKYKPETGFIVREMTTFFKRTEGYELAEFNDLLDGLGRRCDSELMEKLVAVMPSLDFEMDERTYEILLQVKFLLREFREVHRLDHQMRDAGVAHSPRARVVLLKTALKEGDLDAALGVLAHVRLQLLDKRQATVLGLDALLTHLAHLAAREHQTARVVAAFEDLPITTEAVNVLLSSSLAERRTDLVVTLADRMKVLGLGPDASASTTILKALLPEDVHKAEEHLHEVATSIRWTAELVSVALNVCEMVEDMSFARSIADLVRDSELNVRAAVMRGLVGLGLEAEGCNVFEQDVLGGLRLDARSEKVLLSAALKADRATLARALMDNAADVSKNVLAIRACAAESNVDAARKIFENARLQGEGSALLSNALLDCIVGNAGSAEAEAWFERASELGFLDAVSFNMMIKTCVSQGQEGLAKASRYVEKMLSKGIEPNTATFNELFTMIQHAYPRRKHELMTTYIAQMETRGVPANRVTGSIMLKSLQKDTPEELVTKVLQTVGNLQEKPDEVLLSSSIEACVRLRKSTLLREYLQKHVPSIGAVFGVHTFGSLIKAYGYIGDSQAVWRCWKELRNRHIIPTSVTLGCMVEAVVTNGDCEGAYELLRSMEDDEVCSPLLNSVIYCSVVKGFARERRVDRVFQVFDRMKERSVPMGAALFNSTIDVCARCDRMDKVPAVMDEMKRQNVEPTVVTYSTLVKGYANACDLQKCCEIVEEVKRTPGVAPDEIMINSLLDACAQAQDFKKGMEVLEEMPEMGIVPSNFTVSVVVKICSRCRKLEQAFKLCDEISQKCNLRRNEHVWSNLLQACVYCRNMPKAWEVFADMVKAGSSPFTRTYTLLMRQYYQENNGAPIIAQMLRLAFGVRNELPFSKYVDKRGVARAKLESSIVNEALQKLVQKGHVELAEEVFCELCGKCPKLRLDRKIAMNTLSKVQRGWVG